ALHHLLADAGAPDRRRARARRSVQSDDGRGPGGGGARNLAHFAQHAVRRNDARAAQSGDALARHRLLQPVEPRTDRRAVAGLAEPHADLAAACGDDRRAPGAVHGRLCLVPEAGDQGLIDELITPAKAPNGGRRVAVSVYGPPAKEPITTIAKSSRSISPSTESLPSLRLTVRVRVGFPPGVSVRQQWRPLPSPRAPGRHS